MAQVFIISPVFNEAEGVDAFVAEVGAACAPLVKSGHPCRLVCVDDGSTDETYARLTRDDTPRSDGLDLTTLRLSRNFGQQAAIQAGLEHAFGRASEGATFVIMDSDLQHPPSLIPEIVARVQAGADHVQMVRKDAASTGWFKAASSKLFYWLFRKLAGLSMPGGSSDFRALSYPLVKAYMQLPERGRFNRGLFYWLGFERTELPYECRDRDFGSTKYTFAKMSYLALTGISQFTSRPLILVLAATVGFSFVSCLLYLAFELYRYAHGHTYVLGWPSVIFFISFWGGTISLGQLMLAIYVSRVFDEAKGRPTYIVREQSEREH